MWCYLQTFSSSGECVWTALGASVCLVPVFPCHRRSENNPITSSKQPGKPKGRSLSIAEYKQEDSLSAGHRTAWIPSGFCLSHMYRLCLWRFYPSAHLHLCVLPFHANCYSVFHFCDMSVHYLSLFELAVATCY